MTIKFTQRQGRWFWDPIRNIIVEFNPNKETIHDVVKRICKQNNMTLCFDGNPRGTVFKVDKNNQYHELGYHYRGKSEMWDRGMKEPVLMYWDVNVEMNIIEEFSPKSLMAA